MSVHTNAYGASEGSQNNLCNEFGKYLHRRHTVERLAQPSVGAALHT